MRGTKLAPETPTGRAPSQAASHAININSLTRAQTRPGALRVERLLEGDERVLWKGTPLRKPFVLASWGTIPFGAMFLGFSLVALGVNSRGGLDYSTLFLVSFFLVGVGMTFGPTAWQLLRYGNTEYLISDRRIITQTGAMGLDTSFMNLDKIQEVYVRVGLLDKVFGTGNVYAITAGHHDYDGGAGSMGTRSSLRALSDAYAVQKLLQQAMKSSPDRRH